MFKIINIDAGEKNCFILDIYSRLQSRINMDVELYSTLLVSRIFFFQYFPKKTDSFSIWNLKRYIEDNHAKI